MKSNIKNILQFVFLLLSLPTFSQDTVNNSTTKLFLNFYIFESEFAPQKYLNDSTLASKFILYNKKDLPINFPADNRMLTMRATFFIDSLAKNIDWILVCPPIFYPCNIYLNRNLIYKRGNTDDGYSSRMHRCETIFLTPTLLNYGTSKSNQIVFELLTKEGETAPFPDVFIAQRKIASSFSFWHNLKSIHFMQALSFGALLIAIYMLFLFFTRRDYYFNYFLSFSMVCICYILSYLNNTITYDYSDFKILEKIGRTGFPLWTFCTTWFLLEYTKITSRKTKILFILLLLYIPFLVFMWIQPTVNETINIFKKLIIPIVYTNTVFITFIAIYYLTKMRTKFAIVIAILYIFHIICVSHDIFYQSILNIKPSILLIPYSLFVSIIIIFVLLAREQANIYQLAIQQTNELKELTDNLEKLVAERTLELQKTVAELSCEIEIRKQTETTLKEKSDKLLEVNTTKDKLFSIIAHDLRSPFNGIIGFLDLLKENISKYELKTTIEMLEQIHTLSKSTYHLLEHLLSWAKSQTGQISFRPEKIKLKSFFNEIIEGTLPTAKAKGISIQAIQNVDNIVYADENMLKTIMRNLLSNAIKYSNNGCKIKILAKSKDDKIEISVADNGLGMSEEDKNKLFKLNVNPSKYGTADEKGTGLGLIICKEFVEKHGGKIWVESTLGKGSEFIFTIAKFANN